MNEYVKHIRSIPEDDPHYEEKVKAIINRVWFPGDDDFVETMSELEIGTTWMSGGWYRQYDRYGNCCQFNTADMKTIAGEVTDFLEKYPTGR
jgi:hypothetical protein